MATEAELLKQLKMVMDITKPDLEGVWLDGHECARTDLTLDDNPYPSQSIEAHHWQEGWWAGFYGEAVPNVLLSEGHTSEMTKEANDAANLSEFDKRREKRLRLFKNTYKLVGSMLASVVAYEALDIAI